MVGVIEEATSDCDIDAVVSAVLLLGKQTCPIERDRGTMLAEYATWFTLGFGIKILEAIMERERERGGGGEGERTEAVGMGIMS
jgi:hypothetical protein